MAVKSAEDTFDIHGFAESCYEKYICKDIKDLMDFINGLYSTKKQLSLVVYIDEAHNLGDSYWMLLRLLGYLPEDMGIWHAFLGTKSSFNFYSPPPVDCEFSGFKLLAISHIKVVCSLRLRSELTKLVPPYIAIGFDQNAIFTNKAPARVNMGTLHSIKHLSLYGLPMYVNSCFVLKILLTYYRWNAQFREGKEDSLVALAALKLTNGCDFDFKNKYQVLAVLSQLLCVDLVLASSEVTKLVDRSVADHMRILTGFSSDGTKFYTCCPSEPLLALGALPCFIVRIVGFWEMS